MSDSVNWPKASEGGRLIGKEEIRAYWSRQWKEFDPHVDPLEALDDGQAGLVYEPSTREEPRWRRALRY
jgi:hypothetical protein